MGVNYVVFTSVIFDMSQGLRASDEVFDILVTPEGRISTTEQAEIGFALGVDFLDTKNKVSSIFPCRWKLEVLPDFE